MKCSKQHATPNTNNKAGQKPTVTTTVEKLQNDTVKRRELVPTLTPKASGQIEEVYMEKKLEMATVPKIWQMTTIVSLVVIVILVITIVVLVANSHGLRIHQQEAETEYDLLAAGK